jgi:hypothetical protein
MRDGPATDEGSTDARPSGARWQGRLLSALAIVTLAGGALWLGLVLDRPADEPAGVAGQQPPVGAPTMPGRLSISEAPRFETGPDGRVRIRWKTTRPADSFVTFGRADAAEEVAVKDGTLLTDHRFTLAGRPFIRLCRFQVMSVGADGQSATAELGPGGGGRWAVFQPAGGAYEPLREMGAAAAFAWGDYDGDRRLEAAVCRAGEGGDIVNVLGRIGGSAAASPRPLLRLGGACRSVRWADFTADGRPDLLTVGDRLVIHRTDGVDPLRLIEAYVLAEGAERASAAAVADFDADGRADVLAVGGEGGLVLHRNQGPPSYGFAREDAWSPAESAPGCPGLLIAADFTGDGSVDVCVGRGEPALLVGEPGGLVPLPGAFPREAAHLGTGAWAEPADWDGDGDLDIYVATGTDMEGGVLLRNDGVGRFDSATGSAGELAELTEALRCGVWADFDGNGYPDLALGLARGGARLYLNNGDGRFMDATALCDLPVGPDTVPSELSAPDFNSDGAPDLHVSLDGGRALLLENHWWPRPSHAYLKVRPSGSFGVSGSALFLRDRQTERVLASAWIPGRGDLNGTGPAEYCFGVSALETARVEVVFSDGFSRTLSWEKGRSAAAELVVGRGPGAATPHR